ncbi:MAG: transglutaminase family protein [Hyphomicrobiales bacterium]|nr:transglutaminase family protein [Hyphomicrobiales bacterium]
MLIRFGYEIAFDCPAPTHMVCRMDLVPSDAPKLRSHTPFRASPNLRATTFVDEFGNCGRRFTAPVGRTTIWSSGVAEVSGEPDHIAPDAPEISIDRLPAEVLPFLSGSRYVETDRLSQAAWDMFGTVPPGWMRVQAICDFVHARLTFGYEHARATRTAFEAFNERVGVCRDFAHLAVALCRCMNIPARYANGYLGDIGVPPDPAPMDFNAWFEAYLGGRWHTFDARHNVPRIGRILVAHGRDAADIPMIHSFGPHNLASFRVWTDEIADAPYERLAS